MKLRSGFTLIELLLVIGIVAILAAIVIVAINPTKQLGDARNAQRHSDVNTIINAIYQYSIDNTGDLPGCLPSATVGADNNICVSGSACSGVATNPCDLDVLIGTYLVSLPSDPGGATGNDTNYDVTKETEGRVTVKAPDAEQGETISVTR